MDPPRCAELRRCARTLSHPSRMHPQVIQVSPTGLGAQITLYVGDEVVEVAGVPITGGAAHALSLLRQSVGIFPVKIRRETMPDLNCSNASTPTSRSSTGSDDASEAWGPSTRITIMKARDLGITVSNHRGPGVRVDQLEPDSSCALGGMTIGCALISVDGVAVTTHIKAIKELERASKDVDGITAAFTAVIRTRSGSDRPGDIVQCL